MQTFVPDESFYVSVRYLDDKRLGKQRIEAFQLLCANKDKWALDERQHRISVGLMKDTPLRKGWVNHPAAVMWRHYADSLRAYYNACLDEWCRRGKNNTMQDAPVSDCCEIPHWLGDPRVHASHRSRLLFKGKLDLLSDRIKHFSKQRSINKWLKTRGFKEISTFRHNEYNSVMSLLDDLGADPIIGSNYYDQFGWTEPDNIEYYWPSEDGNY